MNSLKALSKSTFHRDHARISKALEDERQIRNNAENRIKKLQEKFEVVDKRYKELLLINLDSDGTEIEKLKKQLEEKSGQLAQAEARIQRELEATKSFTPDTDNETRQSIRNIEGQAELVEAHQKTFDREQSKMKSLVEKGRHRPL